MARYFYARVSTVKQNLARQLATADSMEGIDRVFTDKCTGTNFDRPGYQAMKAILKPGDEVIVSEFDRFGRGWDVVKPELDWFRENDIMLTYGEKPYDMIEEYADTPVGIYVNDIAMSILASFAGVEVESMKEDQRDGLDSMKSVNGKRISSRTGKGFGVDPYEVPGFDEAYKRVLSGESTAMEEFTRLGIPKSKWYRLAKAYQEKQ